MFDREMHQDNDSSKSVTIRDGQPFLVQEGSAKVVPGTFGLTDVEPSYIKVSCFFCMLFSVLIVTLDIVDFLAMALATPLCLTACCTNMTIPATV